MGKRKNAKHNGVYPFQSKKRSRPLKEPHEQEEQYVEPSLSSKILKEALIQQREILEEEADNRPELSHARRSFSAAALAIDSTPGNDDECEEIDDFAGFSDTQSQYNIGQDIDEEEEKVLAALVKERTVADRIFERIKEKDAQVVSEARPLPQLDNAIVDVYKGVGKLLSTYTAGKVPKAFKVVPSLSLWEDVLYLTEPEKWSPNAMYQATRMFSSNLNVKRAQRFYELILLPRVRDDILKNKRLHFALYQSLKKSLYKPAAFFKGILLPLCQSGTCSLREAVIIGSILEKISIPPLHSSAALMKIAEMEYCGTSSYFIKLLLDKKYALPYRVLDAVTAHFLRFLEDTRIMPVIWHQSLLTFVQRYKNELTKEDKNNLDHLIQYQKHHLVTPEIRRELKNSHNRGEAEDVLMPTMSVINKRSNEDLWDIPEVPMEED